MKKRLFSVLVFFYFALILMCAPPSKPESDSGEIIENRPVMQVENCSEQQYEFLASDTNIVLLVSQCRCDDRDTLQNGLFKKEYSTKFFDGFMNIRFDNIKISNSGILYGYTYRMKKIYGKTIKGLRGIWELDSVYYFPEDGSRTLPPDSLVKFEEMIKNSAFKYIDATISGHVNIYVEKPAGSNVSFKQYVYNYINSAKAGQYDLKIDSVSARMVAIIGLHSGDTVFVRKDEAGNIHYTSSNKDTATFYYHKHHAIPDVCPNPIAPEWFQKVFLNSNRVELNKSVGIITDYLTYTLKGSESIYDVSFLRLSSDTLLIIGSINNDTILIHQDRIGYVTFESNLDSSFTYFPKDNSSVVQLPDWFKETMKTNIKK